MIRLIITSINNTERKMRRVKSKLKCRDYYEYGKRRSKLPEDCTLEDVQYQLYVVEKIQRGIYRTETEEEVRQDEVERKFSKWTMQ